MATPQAVVPGKGPRVVINVYADPESGEIYVDREPFYVHIGKQEEVQWICRQSHQSHGPNCFTVEFNGPNGTPFPGNQYHHGEDSGVPRVGASATFYKYTIRVPGVGEIDPQGGVRP